MNAPDDFERQLQAWLEPEAGSVDRIRRQALARGTRAARPARFGLVAGALAAAVAGFVLLVVYTRPPAPGPADVPFRIVTIDNVAIVWTDRGAWILDDRTPPTAAGAGESRLILYGEAP